MPPDSLPDHVQLAQGAYRKVIDASVRRDDHWRMWATRMRSHFDQAIAEAGTETEQLRLMRIQGDLMEKSSAYWHANALSRPDPDAALKERVRVAHAANCSSSTAGRSLKRSLHLRQRYS